MTDHIHLDPIARLIHERLNERLKARDKSYTLAEVEVALKKYQHIAYINLKEGKVSEGWAQSFTGIEIGRAHV